MPHMQHLLCNLRVPGPISERNWGSIDKAAYCHPFELWELLCRTGDELLVLYFNRLIPDSAGTIPVEEG